MNPDDLDDEDDIDDAEDMVVDLYANDPEEEEEDEEDLNAGQPQGATQGSVAVYSGAMPTSPQAATGAPIGSAPAPAIPQPATGASQAPAQAAPYQPSVNPNASSPEEDRYDESAGESELAGSFGDQWNQYNFGDEDIPLDLQEEYQKKEEPISKTALKMDLWTERRGRELVADLPKLKEMGLDEHAAADLYSVCFEKDVVFAKRPDEIASLRSEFMKALVEQPEFAALREQTMFDVDLSEVGLASISTEYVKIEKEFREQKQQQQQKPNKKGSNDPSSQAGGRGAGQEQTHSNSSKGGAVDGVQIKQLVKVAKAIKAAQQEVDQASEAREALGLLSLDKSASRGGMDKAGASKIFKQIRNDRQLARIIEFAGKFRRLARTMQKQKIVAGNDEVTGVCLGGDISKLMKSELVRLVSPATRVLMAKKIIDKRAFVRETRQRVSVSKGPIMMLIDESGSMSGDRIATAKGLALAIAWIAKQQNRWCCLVSFSDKTRVMPLVLSPQAWDSGEIVKWCSHFFGGGTEPPLDKMDVLYAKTGAPAGKTDLVFVSDGDIYLTEAAKQTFLEWKKSAHVRMQTLMIGSSYGHARENDLMSELSEEVHYCQALATDDAGVQQALSI